MDLDFDGYDYLPEVTTKRKDMKQFVRNMYECAILLAIGLGGNLAVLGVFGFIDRWFFWWWMPASLQWQSAAPVG